jgi:uncharacterized membrane protein
MASKAKSSRQHIRRMVILLPIGLLVTSVVFDFAYIATRRIMIASVTDWMIAAGVLAGLIAAPFSWMTWYRIRSDTRAKSIALWHGIGQALLLILFTGSWLLRLDFPQSYEPALMFSFAGVAVALVTGWLGAELLNNADLRNADDLRPADSVTGLADGPNRSAAELRSIR